MDALTVAVVRGGLVESSHRVHAVRLDAGGRVAEERGDRGLVTFMRSAAKPLQALLLVRSYDDLADEEADRLLPDAINVVREYDRASASLLQRRLKIGYARAARIIDQLEARGYIGAFDGSSARVVLRRDDGPGPDEDEDEG